MKKLLLIASYLIAFIATGLLAYVDWSLHPHENKQPLHAPLVSVESEDGIKLLEGAEAIADYQSLLEMFEPQSLTSYCGVATSVTVLNALGVPTTQKDFFTEKTKQVSSQADVMQNGMSLAELAGLLTAHGLLVTITHSANISLSEFRAIVEKNLSNEGDYLIVNYQREVLGQARVGHISPISAYNRAADSVLIMDTATHKYPHTWAPLELLYAGMKTTDVSSAKTRGFIEVSK